MDAGGSTTTSRGVWSSDLGTQEGPGQHAPGSPGEREVVFAALHVFITFYRVVFL